jgi:septum formation protein
VLVLASSSPRRKEILAAAGLSFVARPSHIPEERLDGESPEDYVHRLAEQKAEAVPAGPGEVVLGADTIVVLDCHVLEKPLDASDARRMLKLLSGVEHQVITGICVRNSSAKITDRAVTKVRFVRLTDAEIDDYVATGEPMDKAGGYAIQGRASIFVERIEGCFYNVMGLPIALVYQHLKAFDYP